MSNPILKTPKDKALFEKWNKVLEKYPDCNAENMNREEPKLRTEHNLYFKKVNLTVYEARLAYYANITDILNSYRFKSKVERKIMELHSTGMSLRDIQKELKNTKNKDLINKIIHRIIKDAKQNNY